MYQNCLAQPEIINGKTGEYYPHQGPWMVRASEMPKGKFLKGISNNPGDMRIIAMASRDGWLWPIPSLPEDPRAPSSAGRGAGLPV